VLGPQPLAAISVGNLDTARNVTFLVPGMGTTVANSMTATVKAAGNLRDAQDKLTGGGADSAVVAWIGYHPPGGNDLVGEAQSLNAVTGGKLLSADLTGFAQTRAASGATVANTSVVAHSYGTIVAASALTATSVDHVVFEGSPGIPVSIARTAGDLKVPPGEVFATQASADGLAPLGQLVTMEPRTDPTAPVFGAHTFSSDGSDGSRPVTNHGPIDGNSDTRASYWDVGTESISNAAQATLGRGADIPTRGTPWERLLGLSGGTPQTPTPTPNPSPTPMGNR